MPAGKQTDTPTPGTDVVKLESKTHVYLALDYTDEDKPKLLAIEEVSSTISRGSLISGAMHTLILQRLKCIGKWFLHREGFLYVLCPEYGKSRVLVDW